MSTCVGIYDIYELTDKSSDVVVLGRIEGTLKIGDKLHIRHYREEAGTESTDISTVEVTVLGIEIAPNKSANEATDRQAGILISDGAKMNLSKRDVLYLEDATDDAIFNAHLDVLGDEYVARLNLDIPTSEIKQLSFTDCINIWKIYNANRHLHPDKTDDEKAATSKKIRRLAAYIIEKLFELDHIYCLVNKATGEPHIFAQTARLGDESYQVSPPNVLLFTESQKAIINRFFKEDEYIYKDIDNTSDSNALIKFLGDTFYVNGAEGIMLQDREVSLAAQLLVERPDFEALPEDERPVVNPSLKRWLLLIGQITDIDTPEKKSMYNVFYTAFAHEIVNANFIVPRNQTGDSIYVYTDTKRMKKAYANELPSYDVMTLEEVIKNSDCEINAVNGLRGSCHITKSMYDEILKINNQ